MSTYSKARRVPVVVANELTSQPIRFSLPQTGKQFEQKSLPPYVDATGTFDAFRALSTTEVL